MQPRAQPDAKDLARRVVAGERAAIARALRVADDAPQLGRELILELSASLHDVHVVGITGNPGAGKSTVVDALLRTWRAEGKRVGVLAIDPSSPFSGGAILGDRIRMSRHATDDGVFIRSLATRGALGGLSRSTFDSVRIFDAAGFDVVLIETVGVGQDEVDIARLAHTTVVVMVPGLGDDVQALKAGILEIADIFLINKSDREGADALDKSLRQLMSTSTKRDAYEAPVLRAVALRGEGIDELSRALDHHRQLLAGPDGRKRAVARAQDLFDRLLNEGLIAHGRRALGPAVDDAGARLKSPGADPYREAHRVLALLP